jgi:phosphoenolpyruvate-protein phosphotransferase (PTS system enzyme I)
MIIDNDKEIRLLGTGGSPGICIGKAYLVDKEGVDVVKRYPIDPKDVKNETNRFKAAVKNAKDELQNIISNSPEGLQQHAYVLETHLHILEDKMLYGMAIDAIEKEQVNAEWAVKKAVDKIKSMFREMSNPYLRERASDIAHVADRILRNLAGVEGSNIKDIDMRVILVASDLSPGETSQINLKKIKGFVTDRGGKTSHTSIIARTLEIPAVLGLEKATRTIKNDDLIIVDGLAGIVIVNPEEETLLEFEERKLNYKAHRSVFIRDSHLAAETEDGVRFKVMGNIEQAEDAETAKQYGADGIGLFRTEFQYLKRHSFPDEEELFQNYKETIEATAPNIVTIRTLDINGDKAIANDNDNGREENPALGLRAIRYCLKKQDIFKTQLRAILRAAIYGDVRILIPMIATYEEVISVKKILNNVASELTAEGKEFNQNTKLGIMIEVPSTIFQVTALSKEVDFFSIGTNDLIQYTLAIDRNNKEVAYLYQPLHPAILRMIKHVVDVGNRQGITVCICGEMASDPLAVPILLGMGIQEFSLNPQYIPPVKSQIRSLNFSELKDLYEEVMIFKTSDEVANLMQSRYGALLDDKALSEEVPE